MPAGRADAAARPPAAVAERGRQRGGGALRADRRALPATRSGGRGADGGPAAPSGAHGRGGPRHPPARHDRTRDRWVEMSRRVARILPAVGVSLALLGAWELYVQVA